MNTMREAELELKNKLDQINYIINLGLADQLEPRLEALVERCEKLKEQLGKK